MGNQPRYCTISTGEYDDYRVHAVVRIPDGRSFRDDWLAFWNMIHPRATDLEPLPPLPDKALKKTDRRAWKTLAKAYDRAERRNQLRANKTAAEALSLLACDLGVEQTEEEIMRRAHLAKEYDKRDWSWYHDPDLTKTSYLAEALAGHLFAPTFLAFLKTFAYEEVPYFDAMIDDYAGMTTEHMDAVSGRPEPT